MDSKFSFDTTEPLADACRRFLARVFDLVGERELAPAALEAFDHQSASWSHLRCGDPPVSTKGSYFGPPFECSVAFDAGGLEVRWVAEVLGREQTRESYRAASFAHLRSLGTHLPRATELADLLEPLPPTFHLLFGTLSSRATPLAQKLYIHGWHLAELSQFPRARLLELLGASGLEATLTELQATYERTPCLGVDLEASSSPRTKVYVQVPPHRTPEAVERWQSVAKQGSATALQEFARVGKGGFNQFCNVEVLHLTSRRGAERGLEHLNLFLPMYAHQVEPFAEADTLPGSDRFFAECIHRVFDWASMKHEIYDRLANQLTLVDLDDSFYFHTHVAYQERTSGDARVTVYFTPQIYADRIERVVECRLSR